MEELKNRLERANKKLSQAREKYQENEVRAFRRDKKPNYLFLILEEVMKIVGDTLGLVINAIAYVLKLIYSVRYAVLILIAIYLFLEYFRR